MIGGTALSSHTTPNMKFALRFTPTLRALALACAAVALASPVLRAQVAFDFHLNTSSLIGHPSGPFYLDFQLNDGSGLGNGNNTATLSLFNFHGGGALPDINTFGGVTGNLSSIVTLTDTSFFNEFFQAFTPGASLDFRFELTTVVDAPTPDLFAFSILDQNLFSLPTFSPADAFVTIDITGPNPLVQAFAGNATAPGGIGIPTPEVVPVPEPSTYGLIGALALAGFVWMKRRRRAS